MGEPFVITFVEVEARALGLGPGVGHPPSLARRASHTGGVGAPVDSLFLMRSTVEPLEGNKVKLSVEVDEAEFEKAVDATLGKLAREVRLPGFRPGKTPKRLLAARMGKEAVRQEALRESLPDFYAQALRETDVDAIAPPDIDITSGGEQGGPVAFDAVVQVRPQLSLVGYQGLQVTIPSIAVTDEELRRQIDRLRHPFGELREVDRPARHGDQVTINLHGRREGDDDDTLAADDFLYEVGSGGVVAELDERLAGAKPGDILEFTAEMGDGPIAFNVLVKDVKEMVLPDITDEWASEASEFDTVAELEADLRTRMAEVKKIQANIALRDEAVKALAELVDVEIPEPLVAQEMERRLHDLSHRLQHQGISLDQYLQAIGEAQQQFVDDLRSSASEAVKADLALRALADAEGLEVGEEDVDEEIANLAARLDQDALTLRRELENAEQMPTVRSDIKKAKALGWLMEHVEIVDEEGNPIDRADLEPRASTDTSEAHHNEADDNEADDNEAHHNEADDDEAHHTLADDIEAEAQGTESDA